MMKKATKYGILIFAAVLVVAMAFAGAASAYTVTVDNGEHGSGGAASVNGGSYGTSVNANYRDTVTMRAPTPEDGYEFLMWVPSDLVHYPGSDNKFKMPYHSLTMTATYLKLDTYTVTVKTTGSEGSYTKSASANVEKAYKNKRVILYEPTPAAGYYFAGWESDPKKLTWITSNSFYMPAESVTITAKIAEKPKFAVTVYQGEHGSGASADLEKAYEGQTVTLTRPTPDEGYDFLKWISDPSGLTGLLGKNNEFKMPGQSVNITAIYEKKKTYTVTVVTEEPYTKSASSSVNEAYHYLPVILYEPTPAAGYYFAGWESVPKSLTWLTSNSFSMPAEAVTITAKIAEKPRYAVTVENGTHGSGASADLEKAYKGQTVTLTEPTPDDGYDFFCWVSDPVSVIVLNNKFTMPGEPVTVTAKYAKKLTYPVTVYDGDHGSGATSIPKEAFKNQLVTLVCPAADPGWEFSSWVSEPTVSISALDTFFMPECQVNITAQYTEKPRYAVTVENGTHGSGASADLEKAYKGQTVTLTEPTPDDGYDFVYWASDPTVIILNNKFTMPDESVTITAQYLEKPTHTVTVVTDEHNISAASAIPSEAFHHQLVALIPPLPEPGYSFAGWESEPSVEIAANIFHMPDEPVTITAKIAEKPKFAVTVDSGDYGTGASADLEKAYEGQIVTLTSPTQIDEAYLFVGWSSDPLVLIVDNKFAMPDEPVTITARYLEKPTHTVTVVTDEHNISAASAIPSEAFHHQLVALIPPLPEPGHSFAGWESEPSVEIVANIFHMPDEPVTITAKIAEKPLNEVNVSSGGHGSNASACPSMAYDGQIVTLTPPTEDAGWDFIGWISEPLVVIVDHTFIMPNVSVNITALYLKKPTEVVTVSSGDHGSGALAIPDEAFKYQLVALIPPTADPGWQFIGWGSEPHVTIVDNLFHMPGEPVNITALYEKIHTVTVMTDGHGQASASQDAGIKGTSVMLTATPDAGYQFKEWYIHDGGVIIEDNVFQIYDRDVIIEALFQKTGSAPVATGSITVNIVWPTDGPLTSAYIQLMPSTKYEGLTAPSGSYTHTFTEVEPGVYSVDITYVYADTNATVRKANVLADNTAGPDYTASVSVTLPGLCANTEIIKDENTSIREIKADGLVEEAEYWASNLGGNVTVTLALTEDAMSGSQFQFIQDIRQMMPSVNVSGLQPINATVWLSSDDGIRGLSETETVFELYVPFDGEGKYDIRVFRSHNGTTAELQRLNARPAQGTWTDGTYFIGPQGIFIYSNKFSIYAIGYSSTAPVVYTPSSSHQTGYTVILPESVNTTREPTQNPTPAATQVPTQMPTTQPTQKSPAPFIGLIAGLGIAAVLLRLRR